jgi:hypothetical protein
VCVDTQDANLESPIEAARGRELARRGPTRSTQRPDTLADRPRKTMAMLSTQPSEISFQSPGAESLMPMSFESGRLKTLKA